MKIAATNNLLAALRSTDLEIIAPHLVPQELSSGKTLYMPGDFVKTVYFPTGPAMAAYFIELPEGKGVETTIIGREGALGGIVSQGSLPSYSRCSVLSGGTFLSIATQTLEGLKSQSSSIRDLFARYADCLMAQVFQTTACNAGHTINQRAAKWIIATTERSGEHTIRLSQDQLAEMLGIGRSYISRVIAGLKQAGIIETRRKQIIIRNMDEIENMACDCNQQVKRHFNDVLRGVYPDA